MFQVDTLKSEINNLIQNCPPEIASLRSKVIALDEKIRPKLVHGASRVAVPLGPPVLTMTNYKEYKEANKKWYSPPVYTHHEGYKICLAVHAKGHNGPYPHITVCVRFMKGEFDDYLKWPFDGIIYFRLLDQQNQTDHRSQIVIYDYRVGECRRCRVTGTADRADKDDRAEEGWGGQLDFIAHSDLEPKYLKNDTLLFQVYKTELESSD